MAPSPTGHLHIGTARASLYNYLFAKHHNGTFILRSEDTDKERSSLAYEKEIKDGLEWLGIHADAFYRQSERTHIYQKHLETLVASGAAYLSKESSKKDPGTEVEVVRLKNQNKTITFSDLVRGEITFDTTELGDFVIARAIDDPLYHFTVVVDDIEMEVTHVIRGEDHISNTPRQILIQEALGAERPQYAHLPLILAPDRSKMSKRHGTVSLESYKNEGFLPEALINYFVLLGWNPGTNKELFTLTELIQEFDISKIQKGGAIFDREKLKWFNKQYLEALSIDQFINLIEPYIPPRIQSLPQYTVDRFFRLLPTLRERVEILTDITKDMKEGEYDFAFAAPDIEPDMIKWKNDTSATEALPRLEHAHKILDSLEEDNSTEHIKELLWPYAEEVGKGELLWPLRVALTGKERSPDPFSVIHILGKTESQKRIERACDTIKSA